MVTVISKSIEEIIDVSNQRITFCDLAKAAGVTKGAISTFFKGTSELSFSALLGISDFLTFLTKKDLIKEWCLHLEKPKNQKHALEYLAINQYNDELHDLITKIKVEQTNKELLEWADVYEIYYRFITEAPLNKIKQMIREASPKTMETKTFLRIIEMNVFAILREYQSLFHVYSDIKNAIKGINDDYIKKCYTLRMNEIMAHINLYYLADVNMARKYANAVISSKMSAIFKAHSYYIMGMSYLFENYDETLFYITEYRKICENFGRKDLTFIVDNSDIPFIKNVWNKHTAEPQTKDLSELAHYKALNGCKQEALDLIKKAIKSEGNSDFKLYYKALATGNKIDFLNALILFTSKGERFFAQLPYRVLAADPQYRETADLLLNIN